MNFEIQLVEQALYFWMYSYALRFILLLQKSQVTSLFGAEVLWSKGYTGAKVKMAIFDTGIRANHPHFRNIKVTLIEKMSWSVLCFCIFIDWNLKCAFK